MTIQRHVGANLYFHPFRNKLFEKEKKKKKKKGEEDEEERKMKEKKKYHRTCDDMSAKVIQQLLDGNECNRCVIKGASEFLFSQI